jgi:molecular chaperone DnaK
MLGHLYGGSAAWLKSLLGHGDSTAPAPQALAAQPASRRLAVGIDLGTTLSAAAYISETGQSTMIRNGDGEILTPSVVQFERNGKAVNFIVGQQAKKSVGTHSGAVAECVKRDMGSTSYSHRILGERLPPEVIQAVILRQLKTDIDKQLKRSNVDGRSSPEYKVVITVPAYFDEPRRHATALAGKMAGLDVIDIVNEPTAAALAFGEYLGYLDSTGMPREEITLLVYDLGGGTFDVTLLQLKPGDIRALATDGDVQLGGRDWDACIVGCLAEQFVNQHGIDPRDDPGSNATLYHIAEEVKHALSNRPQAARLLAFNGRECCAQMTRDRFEEETTDLLERTADTTRDVLAAAKMDWAQVDRILLVGGSTRMPMVACMLEHQSGITPDRSVNPDEAVARGAALYARYLLADEHGQSSTKIVDVNAHSLGIEGTNVQTGRRENCVLIPLNTPLPAQCNRRFVTARAGQRSILVNVLEGEWADPASCTLVGRVVLPDLPRDLPEGHPVEVSFRYSRSARLQVRTRIPGTDRAVEVEFERHRNSSEHVLPSPGIVWSDKRADALERYVEQLLAGSRNSA